MTPEQIAEIEAGCEGVTPGDWHYEPREEGEWRKPAIPAIMVNDEGKTVIDCLWGSSTEEGDLTYRHIARLDPATVRELCRLARLGLTMEQGNEADA